MSDYIKEIRKIERLTDEKTRELIISMREGNDNSRKKLIEHNLRLVVDIAYNYIYQIDLSIEDLYQEMKQLLLHAEEMGFVHQNLLTFLTLMTLAVSPEVKLSDLGLIDVINKKFLPLVASIKENN